MVGWKLSVLLFVCVLCVCDAQLQLKKEAYYTVPQYIASKGYPTETHRAHTEDGYILQMHRIPAGRRTARRSTPSAKGKRAVLIVHGLAGSSSNFVIMGPERSLAFILADAGYDVWLANLRGNQYTTHKNLTRDDARFWEYSFHEHGKHDVPAMIDKILKVTGLQKVLYIGHSMGTTSFFTMLSERPEYNDKIVAFVAMAPAVYADNMRVVATMLLKSINVTGVGSSAPCVLASIGYCAHLDAAKRLGIMRQRGMVAIPVPPPQMIEMLLGRSMCNMRSPREDICLRTIYLVMGEDYEQHDVEMAPVIITKVEPASLRQLEHFGKIAMTGVFTTWGGGVDSKVRPYNLTNVKVPVILLYGEGDQLTQKSQIKRLADQLNSTGVLEDFRPAPWAKFNHLDFAFSKDVGKILNKPVVLPSVDMLYNKYEPSS